jgi:hypothetical protein
VEHLRIDEGTVGRADGIQEQAQAEDELTLLVFIKAFNLRSGLEQRCSSRCDRDNFLPYT